MQKIRVLLFLIFITFQTKAQIKIDSTFIPNYDSLKLSLQDFYRRKTTAEQQQYKYKQKWRWLKYLPSVGYSFFLNTPIVSYNTNEVYNAINDKHIIRAQCESLSQINETLYNEDLTEVKYTVEILRDRIQQYNSQLMIFDLEKKRYEIVEKSYTNKEITPTEFITKQIDYNNFQGQLRKEYTDIKILRNEILIKAKKTAWNSLF